GRHPEGAGRSRPDRRPPARGRRRLRGGARAVREGGHRNPRPPRPRPGRRRRERGGPRVRQGAHRHRRPRRPAPGGGGEVLRELVARAHGEDQLQERGPRERLAIVNVLDIDIGGTSVKVLASGEKEPRKFPSGPHLTPRQMVAGVKKLARGWKFDAVSRGYPGMVIHNRPVAEPRNLGRGWIGFDYRAGFGKPVKIVNDAAMQALGS